MKFNNRESSNKSVDFYFSKRFNEHNQDISSNIEIVGCSELHGDMENPAEMSGSLLGVK